MAVIAVHKSNKPLLYDCATRSRVQWKNQKVEYDGGVDIVDVYNNIMYKNYRWT